MSEAWRQYGDRDGHSGVAAYRLGPGRIDVAFKAGGRYRYDASQPGPDAVAAMRVHAQSGAGLSTYISQHVRERYAARLD